MCVCVCVAGGGGRGGTDPSGVKRVGIARAELEERRV